MTTCCYEMIIVGLFFGLFGWDRRNELHGMASKVRRMGILFKRRMVVL